MSELSFEEYHLYSPYYVDSSDRTTGTFKYKGFFEKLNNLPPNIKDLFLGDFETAKFIKRVITDNSLDEKRGEELARVVKDLLFADLYLGNVVNAIKDRLGIDEQKAKTIAGLIVIELFLCRLFIINLSNEAVVVVNKTTIPTHNSL